MSEDKLSYEDFMRDFLAKDEEQSPQIQEMLKQAKTYPVFNSLFEKFTRDLYEEYLKEKFNNKL